MQQQQLQWLFKLLINLILNSRYVKNMLNFSMDLFQKMINKFVKMDQSIKSKNNVIIQMRKDFLIVKFKMVMCFLIYTIHFVKHVMIIVQFIKVLINLIQYAMIVNSVIILLKIVLKYQSNLCTSCYRSDCELCESIPGLYTDNLKQNLHYLIW
ncbi:unnamed protein product [Paramecium sonneborni]|uniref:Transmembrane protein n=1 Tax=Paramecium sonneborni TaxID=65129 RepID=A0A8S1R4W6_9CILI|nr:unnamed protein product [Paramecium sonneborni]